MKRKQQHNTVADQWAAVQAVTSVPRTKTKTFGDGQTAFRVHVETLHRYHCRLRFSDRSRDLPNPNTENFREATTEIFKGVMIGAQQMQAGQQVTEFPIDFEKVGQIILIAIGMYVISAVFNFLQQFIMTRVSQRTVYELRRDLDEK